MSQTIGRFAGAGATAAFLVLAALYSHLPGWLVATLLVAGLAGLAPYAAGSADRTRVLVGAGVAYAALVVLCSGTPNPSSNIGWFGICTLVVLASAVVGSRGLLGASVVGLVIIGAQALWHPDPGWLAWVGGVVLTFVACWAVEREHALVQQLRTAQAGLAERSRLEERTRIAHEMHDVMGHALTVSLLHITSARLAVEEDPAAAAASLEEAERLSRRSLEEVRSAVGVLRDGSAPVTPAPGVGGLDDLVDAVRRGGVEVALTVGGPTGRISEVTGLAVYRIVQEALTNVARHAPAAVTTVDLTVTDEGLRLRVDSAAPARADARPGGGIASMTERAAALGGTLAAGPGGPGWRVEALLPLLAGAPAGTGVPS